MKVWNAIFNLIGVLIIAFMIIVINNLEEVNKRNFEEIRLAQAVDYANEGAFRMIVESDSIGTDYTDGGLEEIKINPSGVVDTFSHLMCLSYDIIPSPENLDTVKQSIVTGVMCAVDGYYVLEEFEIDNDPMDAVIGGEFELRWGLKRPYIVYSDELDATGKRTGKQRMFAVNLVNEKSIEYLPESEQPNYAAAFSLGEALIYRMTYAADEGEDLDENKGPVGFYDKTLGPDEAREKAWSYSRSEIGKLLTNDIAIAINARNIRSRGKEVKQFYIPSSDSYTGISHIKSPTLIIIFQDSTFLNGFDLDSVSVGGHRVKVASKVIGFTQTINGKSENYYCFAGQQLGEPGVGNEVLFKNVHEAALEGYKPHMAFLKKPYGAAVDE